MKTTHFFFTALAATMLAVMPYTPILAETAADSTGVTLTIKKDNGRPVTDKEKEVAREMVKKGAKMASKSARLAVTAVTNPSKADSLGKEIEAMGEDMERLGDSLESMSEDTTFFYEGADSDTISLSQADVDDLFEDWEDSAEDWGIAKWILGLGGGALGIMGGLLGILIAIFAVLLVFGILLSPIWVIALVIWLIARNSRKPKTRVYQTTSTGQPLHSNPQQAAARQAAAGSAVGQAATGQTAAGEAAAGETGGEAPNEQAATNLHVGPIPSNEYVQPYPDENQEMWKSGIMYACIGVGLILLFIGIGAEDLWGIGALVICIGVAKLVIATTTKNKQKDEGSFNKNEKA